MNTEEASWHSDNQSFPSVPDMSLPTHPYGVKKSSMAGTLPSLSIQGPKVAVWVLRSKSMAVSQKQRAGNPVYPFHMCEHADIMHIWETVALLQEGGEKWLSATTAKQIPPSPFQIRYWIQPDPAHNTHRCEQPDGLVVGLSQKWTG